MVENTREVIQVGITWREAGGHHSSAEVKLGRVAGGVMWEGPGLPAYLESEHREIPDKPSGVCPLGLLPRLCKNCKHGEKLSQTQQLFWRWRLKRDEHVALTWALHQGEVL